MFTLHNRGFLGILFLLAGCVSCSRCSLTGEEPGNDTITLLSYNVENIFDDKGDGTEYPEFDPGGGEWNTQLFHTRLMNLAEVIRLSCDGGPDIIALQEIENSNVLGILVTEYLKGMGYRWRVCIPEPGAAVNTGLVSRLPLETFRAHRLESGDDTILRNILEVHIETEGGTLVIFNNHWKSKLGGAVETEIFRLRAASLVSRRIREMEGSVGGILVVGDLNENPDEYILAGEAYTTALMPVEVPEEPVSGPESLYLTGDPSSTGITGSRVVLFTPWHGTEGGSYLYKMEWEQIDHTLVGAGLFDGQGLEYGDFRVMDDAFLLSEAGIPLGWNGRIGSGYSDHLPLFLRIEKR